LRFVIAILLRSFAEEDQSKPESYNSLDLQLLSLISLLLLLLLL
jgi:hypothetical protein